MCKFFWIFRDEKIIDTILTRNLCQDSLVVPCSCRAINVCFCSLKKEVNIAFIMFTKRTKAWRKKYSKYNMKKTLLFYFTDNWEAFFRLAIRMCYSTFTKTPWKISEQRKRRKPYVKNFLLLHGYFSARVNNHSCNLQVTMTGVRI